MPVVMTGSPGGTIGGNSGSHFGSGLHGLSTSPKKTFTPALDVWVRRAEEDMSLVKERRDEYEQLKDARLAMVAEQGRQDGEAKSKGKDAFAQRQAERLAAEAAEAERLKKWRLDSIEQNKVDYHMDMREGEPGYGPTRWCWPTAHHHPRQCASGIDVSVDFVLGPGAVMAAASSDWGIHSERKMLAQPGEEELLKLAESLPSFLDDMKKREAAQRKVYAANEDAAEAQAKAEREAEAKAMRDDLRKKEQARAAAERARSKQIKQEMANETAKLAATATKKAKTRFEKSLADRAENVRHLIADTRLRDEDEIANERREGSKMSKGGKGDIIASAKAENQ